MLGTSPSSGGVVYHAAAPIYWHIALRLNSPCANILALRILRDNSTYVHYVMLCSDCDWLLHCLLLSNSMFGGHRVNFKHHMGG